MRPKLSALFLLSLLAALLAACASDPLVRRAQLMREGEASGFKPVSFGAAPPIAGLLRERGHGGTLWVVIEGDGLAWLGLREPSPDPTPSDAVGWRLAKGIGQDKVLYLARPCQFLTRDELAACTDADWTEARFAEKWVVRLNDAVDAARRSARADRVVLSGYSGGGTLAALLALRRDDVDALITVAAPLDHAAWSRHHGVSALSRSLNPADGRARLAHLPQLHLAGTRDTAVPPVLAERFVAAYPPGSPANVLLLERADHSMAVVPDLSRLEMPLRTPTGRAATTGGPGISP